MNELAILLTICSITEERHRFDQVSVSGCSFDDVSEEAGFVIANNEAAFLFGVIPGCHLSWPVIEAMPPPYVPLARELAAQGHVVLRYDLGGVGDSLAPPGAPDNVAYPAHALEERDQPMRKCVFGRQAFPIPSPVSGVRGRCAMNRDNWKEIPASEWKRRLNQVREIALQRLAAHGLGDDDRDEDIGGMIVYGDDGVASLLNPGLVVERDEIDQIIKGVLRQTAR